MTVPPASTLGKLSNTVARAWRITLRTSDSSRAHSDVSLPAFEFCYRAGAEHDIGAHIGDSSAESFCAALSGSGLLIPICRRLDRFGRVRNSNPFELLPKRC